MSNKVQDQQVFKISKTTIHEIGKKTKKRLDFGDCELSSDPNGQNFLKVDVFMHQISKVQFGKKDYKHSVSYFFCEDNDEDKIFVLSITKQDQEIMEQFEKKLGFRNLSQGIKEIFDIQPHQTIRKKIQYCYPEWSSTEVQGQSLVAREIGALFGTVSNWVTRPLSKVGKAAEHKKEQVFNQQLNDETKENWQSTKEKTQHLNQSVSSTLKPVADSARSFTSALGHSFNHSNNAFIRSIRQWGLQTKQALNEGYFQGLQGGNPQKSEKVSKKNQLNQEPNSDLQIDNNLFTKT